MICKNCEREIEIRLGLENYYTHKHNDLRECDKTFYNEEWLMAEPLLPPEPPPLREPPPLEIIREGSEKVNCAIEQIDEKPRSKSIVAFITTLRFNDPTGSSIYQEKYREAMRLDTRTVGFQFSMEAAIITLEHNYGSLSEDNYYPWAVIETFEGGVYPNVIDQKWFRWEKDLTIEDHEGKWVPCEFPTEVKKYADEVCCHQFTEIG